MASQSVFNFAWVSLFTLCLVYLCCAEDVTLRMNDPRLVFSGPTDYDYWDAVCGGYMWIHSAGTSVSLTFAGTAVTVTFLGDAWGALSPITIDGSDVAEFNPFAPGSIGECRLMPWSSGPLLAGQHTITITNTGIAGNTSATRAPYIYMNLRSFVYSALPATSRITSSQLAASQTATNRDTSPTRISIPPSTHKANAGVITGSVVGILAFISASFGWLFLRRSRNRRERRRNVVDDPIEADGPQGQNTSDGSWMNQSGFPPQPLMSRLPVQLSERSEVNARSEPSALADPLSSIGNTNTSLGPLPSATPGQLSRLSRQDLEFLEVLAARGVSGQALTRVIEGMLGESSTVAGGTPHQVTESTLTHGGLPPSYDLATK